MFGSSVHPDSRPQIDFSSAIDAIGSGASSLIRAAYLRKQGEYEMARQQRAERAANEQRQYQRTRDTIEDTQRDREFGLKKADSDARIASERAKTEREQAEAGFVPGAPAQPAEYTQYPISAMPTPLQQPSPTISSAMGGVPGMQVIPSRAPGAVNPMVPTPSPSIANAMTREAQPETKPHYDLERSKAVITTQARADATKEAAEIRARGQAEVEGKRAVAREKTANIMANAQKEVAKIRANAPKSGGAGGSKGMTGNRLDESFLQTASGILAAYQDEENPLKAAIADFEDSDEGTRLSEQGMTRDHFVRAYGKMIEKDVGAAEIAGRGPRRVTPQTAAGKVKDTRKAASKGGMRLKEPPAAADTTSNTPPAGATDTTTKAGAKDDYTSAELAAAWKAGKRTDADIAAYIRSKRGGKK